MRPGWLQDKIGGDESTLGEDEPRPRGERATRHAVAYDILTFPFHDWNTALTPPRASPG